MALAIEDLTPEAQAIAARLHPKVKEYLEQKAGKAAAEKADRAAQRTAKASPSQGGRASASRGQGSSSGSGLASAARFEKQLDAITPGRGVNRSTGGRLVSAAFIGVLALVVLSQVLGQPFKYSLQGTAAAVGNLKTTPYKPLYSGQPLNTSPAVKA